ncbi:hypothetical protein BOX15_Mlig002613g1 [Macrostomum lignano]|uniref:Uncharacterized protein n=2 Tax=Macrostomum lignano TaxID=282301 RepID=A0A267GYH2_9PLAT|nr:hypothetical protein BOX15_Mlig002613g1 [Macrostomum lignano]
MECKICNVKKLTSEYPSNPLSDLCEHHHLLVCLRCVIREVDKNYQCPVEGCSIMIDAGECIPLWECKAKLKQLTFDYSDRERAQAAEAAAAASASGASSGIFTVNLTTLLGESLSVDLDSNQPVDKLKDQVLQQWTDRSKNKIKLLFNGDELTDSQSLASAGLSSGCRVQVLFVLQELTPDLTEVRMCMSWGWPGGKDHTDYLDTACFTFSAGATGRIQFLHCIDFRSSHRQNAISAGISQTYNQVIRHDGPARKCGQTRTSESSFTVWPQNLDELRAPVGRFDQQNVRTVPVTHLFFVTFTYRNTNIDRFNHPQLQVFDQRDPQTPLCSTNLNPRAKGLVVCLLSKPGGRGAWQVTDVGQPLAEGSIRDYRPVERACVRIINSTRRV